ncbi:MAG: redoxin domain-containing protein [Bacteroidales bacterium]
MKALICILVTLFIKTCMAQPPHTLKVNVSDLPDQEVYLAGFYGEQNNIIDTAKPDRHGNVVFQLNSTVHPGMYRVFLDKNRFFDIIFNHENIEIKTDYNDLYKQLIVVYSKENEIYYDFLKQANEYRRKFDLLAPVVDYYPRTDSFYFDVRRKFIMVQSDFLNYIQAIMDENPSAFVTKIIRQKKPLFYDPQLNEQDRRQYAIDHYFDNVKFNDAELLRTNLYTNLAIDYLSLFSNPNLTQDKLEDEFIKAVDQIMLQSMENSIVYEFIVDYLVGGFERFHFEKVLDYIAENYSPEQCENEERKTDLQTRLEKYAELSVGKKAPEITLPDRNGNQVSLSSFRSDYTLVIFWASWCPHCIEILPDIHKLYKESINSSKMKVLSVSIDTKMEDWVQILSRDNYVWTSVSDLKGWESPAAIDYNIYATPTMFLLDKAKNIVAKPITRSELVDALIRENILK